MHSLLQKRSLMALALIVTAVALSPFAVNAQPAHALEAQNQAQERRETAQSTSEAPQQQRIEEVQNTGKERPHEENSGRLEAAKLKACQNREKAIKNIMTRIANRSTKQLAVFTTISDRTQAFYSDKGNVLSNYDALIAEVTTAKAAAENTIATIESTSDTFNCEGDNPKGVASSFKDALRAQNVALKDYKTAIKNLIVGVKTVQSTTTDSSNEEVE